MSLTQRCRPMVVLALVGALVALPSGAADGRSTRSERTIPWGLSGCKGVIVLVPTPAESLRPHLPSGFTAVVPDSVRQMLPPDPRLDAVFGLEVLECAEGEGLDGPIDGLDYASFWTFVQPPRRHARHRHDLSFVKWDTLVPDAPRRDLLVDHGLRARDGVVTFDRWTPLAPDAGVAFDVGWTFAGGEAYRFAGTAATPVDFRGSFIEFSPASDGLARWQTKFAAPLAFGGAGVAEFAPGGMPASVVGHHVADAYFLVPVDLSFFDASLSLP